MKTAEILSIAPSPRCFIFHQLLFQMSFIGVHSILPGFPFYKTLADPPMLLELNIPSKSKFFLNPCYTHFFNVILSSLLTNIEATIYVKKRKVFMLFTDPKTGILKKTVPDLFDLKDKLAFIKYFVDLCVRSSRPPAGKRNIVSDEGAPRYDLGDSIATRIVAVVKKIDNTGEHDHVVMQTLLLNTLGLQGYLQLALDGQ